MMQYRFAGLCATCCVLLGACGSGASDGSPATVATSAGDTQPYGGIGPDETVHFTGTEPFWGGQVSGATLTYATPDDPEGETIAVSRFAGRGGLSFAGTLDGQDLVLALTPGKCSDGMSERSYPFTVTLQIAGEQRNGCAWSDKQPFSGPPQP
jgi:uncharacterized membrane protein